MDKNYTEVIIAGKTYTLGGYEDEEYLQRIAAYINLKLNALKKESGYNRQPEDYKAVQLNLNIADDYFKARKKAEELEAKTKALEKEIYNLKHEIVTNRIGF